FLGLHRLAIVHPRVVRILLGVAVALSVCAPAWAANVPPTPQAPPPGYAREEYPVNLTPATGPSRARHLPHLTPPPLEEVLIFQDSLNALSINNQGNWTHVDNSARPTAWHIDTFYGCQNKAWWCGEIDSTWTFDTNRGGYENNWTQYLSNSVWLDSLPPATPVKLGFR